MRRSNSSKKQHTGGNAADTTVDTTEATQPSNRKSRYSRLSAYENGETTFLLLVQLINLEIRITLLSENVHRNASYLTSSTPYLSFAI